MKDTEQWKVTVELPRHTIGHLRSIRDITDTPASLCMKPYHNPYYVDKRYRAVIRAKLSSQSQ